MQKQQKKRKQQQRAQNHHLDCTYKITTHNQTQIAKEEEERRGCRRRRRCRRRKNEKEKEKKKEERRKKKEKEKQKERENVQRSNEFGDFGVCGKVGGATSKCEIKIKREKYYLNKRGYIIDNLM